MAAKASCAGEYTGPGLLVVKVGRTSPSVESVATVAMDAPAPSALNETTGPRRVPARIDSPTMPFDVMMTAANTVSRARVSAEPAPAIINVTIRATSITVTATASTSDPNGSPTRCATTSAWCTAASTAPARRTVMTATADGGRDLPQAAARTMTATMGTAVVQDGTNERWLAAGVLTALDRHHTERLRISSSER